MVIQNNKKICDSEIKKSVKPRGVREKKNTQKITEIPLFG